LCAVAAEFAIVERVNTQGCVNLVVDGFCCAKNLTWCATILLISVAATDRAASWRGCNTSPTIYAVVVAAACQVEQLNLETLTTADAQDYCRDGEIEESVERRHFNDLGYVDMLDKACYTKGISCDDGEGDVGSLVCHRELPLGRWCEVVHKGDLLIPVAVRYSFATFGPVWVEPSQALAGYFWRAEVNQ